VKKEIDGWGVRSIKPSEGSRRRGGRGSMEIEWMGGEEFTPYRNERRSKLPSGKPNPDRSIVVGDVGHEQKEIDSAPRRKAA
jgi:hypothetical protein